jgi:plasmid stabilization system protein ParE
MRVILTAAAESDLDQAARWYSNQGERLAKNSGQKTRGRYTNFKGLAVWARIGGRREISIVSPSSLPQTGTLISRYFWTVNRWFSVASSEYRAAKGKSLKKLKSDRQSREIGA